MSQKRLAHEAGIDVRTLRRIEGGVSVSPESYRAVCLALNIDPSVSTHEVAPLGPPTLSLALANRLDGLATRSLAYSRTRKGKAVIAALAVAVAVSAGTAVRAWWFQPNVSVTIAFDQACDDYRIWSKTFSAMDREFPGGYTFKDRIDGTKDCVYNFVAYYDAAGPRDSKLWKLVRNMENVGTKTTVTYLSGSQPITPRPLEFWDKDNRITPATVGSFARYGYEKVYNLDRADLQGDIVYTRSLFSDQASFDDYVRSLKSSGNLHAIEKHGLGVSVLTAPATLSEKGPDDIWTVKFRSKISYSGETQIDECLDVTARIKEAGIDLGFLSIVSSPSVCRDKAQ